MFIMQGIFRLFLNYFFEVKGRDKNQDWERQEPRLGETRLKRNKTQKKQDLTETRVKNQDLEKPRFKTL
jgi:hypothetical protein